MTNSGHASTLATTDAAAPTLRRIERAAIAAATPITYHSRLHYSSFIIPTASSYNVIHLSLPILNSLSHLNHRELLLLIHEHLQASGLTKAADTLLKEAQLTPLPSLAERTPSYTKLLFRKLQQYNFNGHLGVSPVVFFPLYQILHRVTNLAIISTL